MLHSPPSTTLTWMCKLFLSHGLGPAHWELLAKGRALDNQVYVASVSPARDKNAGYVAWGHSTIVDPFGTVVASAAEAEEIVYADIDLNHLEAIRSQIPVTFQRRNDVYELKQI